MLSQHRVLCGVPADRCSGSKLITDQSFVSDKCHASHEDAYRCMARHLVKDLGYTSLGGNAFMPPQGSGECIRVLTRKSKYGGLLVAGKPGSPRFMPEKRNAGNRGVVIG